VEDLTRIRHQIYDTTSEVIHDSSYINKIILLRGFPGIGKTYNVRDAVYSNNTCTIWLGPSYEQVEYNIAKPKNIFMLQGKNKNNCKRAVEVNSLGKKFYININKVICPDCKYLEGCPYHEQYKTILPNCKSGWCTQHTFLNTGIISKSFDKTPDGLTKTLVIDEYFLSSIVSQKVITAEDCEKFKDVLDDVIDYYKLPPGGKIRNALVAMYNFSIAIANMLLYSKTKEIINGHDFITYIKNEAGEDIENIEVIELLKGSLTDVKREIVEFAERQSDNKSIGMSVCDLSSIDDAYNEISRNEKINSIAGIYNGYLKNIFKGDDKTKIFKDLFPIFCDMIPICNEYKNATKEVILPFKMIDKKLHYWSVTETLPYDTVTIIIDNHTPKKIYEDLYKREVIEKEFQFDFKQEYLKIYQLDEGYYPKQSLYYEETRERLFSLTFDFIMQKPEEPCAIFIASGYEEDLKHYLKKSKVDTSKIHIYHFYGSDSIGSNELANYNRMVIAGSPEPNFKLLKSKIEMLYIGQEPIKIEDFDRNNRRYPDERVQLAYEIYTNEHIESLIHRLRPLETDNQKEVLLLTKVNITLKTERFSLKELRAKLRNMDTSEHGFSGELADRIRQVTRGKNEMPISTVCRNVRRKKEL
jgi:hypothetical protein